MISYWKNFRNLSSLLRNLTYLSLLNSFLFLSRFSVSLKCLDNYFFRWFANKSLLSRFSLLISYNMCSSNHFSISSRFPCFSRSRVKDPGPGSGFGSRIQGPGPGYRSSQKTLVPESLFYSVRLAILLKYSLWHRCFPRNFANTFLGIPFFTEHLRWLLL